MEEVKQPGRLQWIVFIFIIPLLFAGILSGVVLQILGVPVIGKLQAWIMPPKQAKQQAHVPTTQDQLNQQIQLVNQLKGQNEDLKAQLESKNQEIETLKQQNQQIQDQLNAMTKAAQSYENQAKMFSNMKPDQAAKVMEALPTQDALEILAHMNQPAEAAILEKMNPQTAAQFVSKLMH
jgi:flagellar motility protein MotE (MotC chaperone)